MIVLVAVTEKQVVITDNLNPNPISGRAAIFARVNAPTETRFDIEIVGVYADLPAATAVREAHAKAHPGRKYVQKVASLDDGIPEPPPPTVCIRCHTPITIGSFCSPCQAEHWRELRERDPEFPTEPPPAAPATAGMETRFMVNSNG